MNWLLVIAKVVGASFAGASSLVQLQSEIESNKLSKRVSKLEDPISNIHEDVPELSKELYRALKKEDSTSLSFEESFYTKYSRALASLEAQGYLKGKHAIGKRYAAGIRIKNPLFIMYLCALEEEMSKMETLVDTVNNCKVGEHLRGRKLKETLNLPLPVIEAVFEIFEFKGYGICSKTIGSSSYIGKA